MQIPWSIVGPPPRHMEGYPAFASHHGPPQHAVGNMGTKQAYFFQMVIQWFISQQNMYWHNGSTLMSTKWRFAKIQISLGTHVGETPSCGPNVKHPEPSEPKNGGIIFGLQNLFFENQTHPVFLVSSFCWSWRMPPDFSHVQDISGLW